MRSYICLLWIAVFGCSLRLAAVQAVLAWDPNADSNLAGYKLYYGTAPGVYDRIIDAGNRTNVTVTELVSGSVYFFVVTAYNNLGTEGDPSAEISYLAPPPPPTAVWLTGFTATATGPDTSLIAWRTGVEQDVVAFLLERLDPQGQWQVIPNGIIPAAGGGRPNSYQVRDEQGRPGEASIYRLSEIDLQGRRRTVAQSEAVAGATVELRFDGSLCMVKVHSKPGVVAALEACSLLNRTNWQTLALIRTDSQGLGAASLPATQSGAPVFVRARIAAE